MKLYKVYASFNREELQPQFIQARTDKEAMLKYLKATNDEVNHMSCSEMCELSTIIF
jgi:hypothetical protein